MAEASKESIEEVARVFHETYEALAPMFNYETRKESRVKWDDVPVSNKDLMIGVVTSLVQRGLIKVPE